MMKLGERSLNGIKKYIFPVVGIGHANFIALSMKVGTAHEKPEEAGIAHFLEHIQMSFDFERETSFECFANTDFYSTTYYFNVDLCEFEMVVEIIENIICGVYLNNENMERARKEVLDEYGVYNEKNKDNDFRYLLGETEYIKKLPIGNYELIKRFSFEDVKGFFKRTYVLQNMCIIWIVDEESYKEKGEEWIENLEGKCEQIEETFIRFNYNSKRGLKIKRKNQDITYYFYVERDSESLDEVLLEAIENYLLDYFQIEIKITKVILSSKDEFIKINIKNDNDIDIIAFLKQIEENDIQKKYEELWKREIIGYNCNQVRQQLVNCFIFDLPVETNLSKDVSKKFKTVKNVFFNSEVKEIEL